MSMQKKETIADYTIRFFDMVFAYLGLALLSPVFLVIALLIQLDSPEGVFFKQIRVGQYGKHFTLFKFRTMRSNSETKGQLTVGARDPRITKIGFFLRKYKLDELPQLINVLIGDMSLVGPRPEVPKYVNLYTPDQKKVLLVKPGITDKASIEFMDENELLSKQENPEAFYIKEIMPTKINLNMEYVQSRSVLTYFKIIFQTIFNIFKK